MDKEELNLVPSEAQLVNLKKYLNYQLSTFLLFALSFFSIILIFILSALAFLFMPYVIFVLYQNEKYSWIISLILMVVLPVFLLVFLVEQTYTLMILLLIELAVFYVYCFSLRIALNGWVKEIFTVKLIEFQRKKRLEQQKDDLF